MSRAPDIAPDEVMRLRALRSLKLVDTPLEERFERLTRLAKRVLGIDVVAVSLVESDRQYFKSIQGVNICQTSREISFCGHAILKDDLFIVEDARTDERFKDNPLVTGPPHVVFYAGVPLYSPDGFKVGMLCATHSKTFNLSQTDKDQLRDIAALVELEMQIAASNAVQASLVEEVSSEQRRGMIDSLTRLWNRSAIYDIAAETLRRAAKHDAASAILMLDLDKFKAINDTHGHNAGDEALRVTAKRMLACLRDTDVVGRVGGDEFLVALSPCEDEHAVGYLAERLVEAVSCEPVHCENAIVPIRASVGAVTIPPAWNGTVEDAVDRADKAMYRCKRDPDAKVVVVPVSDEDSAAA